MVDNSDKLSGSCHSRCVGPLQLPLADFSVIAQSHFALSGAASSIGEQPIKGFLSPENMARLTVAESLTNMCFARVSAIENIKVRHPVTHLAAAAARRAPKCPSYALCCVIGS